MRPTNLFLILAAVDALVAVVDSANGSAGFLVTGTLCILGLVLGLFLVMVAVGDRDDS
jgi:hypothetical protein